MYYLISDQWWRNIFAVASKWPWSECFFWKQCKVAIYLPLHVSTSTQIESKSCQGCKKRMENKPFRRIIPLHIYTQGRLSLMLQFDWSIWSCGWWGYFPIYTHTHPLEPLIYPTALNPSQTNKKHHHSSNHNPNATMHRKLSPGYLYTMYSHISAATSFMHRGHWPALRSQLKLERWLRI